MTETAAGEPPLIDAGQAAPESPPPFQPQIVPTPEAAEPAPAAPSPAAQVEPPKPAKQKIPPGCKLRSSQPLSSLSEAQLEPMPGYASPRARNVHSAMQRFMGDRRRVAEELHLDQNDVTKIINGNKFLKLRWRCELDGDTWRIKPAPPPDNLTKGIRQTESRLASLTIQDDVEDRIIMQIRQVEKRLSRPTKLKINDNGEPVEEKMLRDSLDKLYNALLKHRKMNLDQFKVMSKVKASKEGTVVGGGRGKPGKRLGLPPKGE